MIRENKAIDFKLDNNTGVCTPKDCVDIYNRDEHTANKQVRT
jgi:hypothetical protein